MKSEKKYEIKTNKVLNTVGFILCLLILPVLIINMTLFIHSIVEPETPPHFLGHTPMIVDSGSMSPLFEVGDLAILRNITAEEAAELEVGEVICYQTGKVYVTHRIIDTEVSDSGVEMFVTQGDANNVPDTVRVSPLQVLGVYRRHIGGLGSVILWLQSPLGMICCVVIPLFALFIMFYWSDKHRYKQAMKQMEKEIENNPANK